MFGSRVGFSGVADRTAPFPVGSNLRWRPEAILIEELQMAIPQQRVIRYTSCLDRLGTEDSSRVTQTLFMIGLRLREALDRLRVRLNMYLVVKTSDRTQQSHSGKENLIKNTRKKSSYEKAEMQLSRFLCITI